MSKYSIETKIHIIKLYTSRMGGTEVAKGVPYLTTIHSDQGIQYQSNKHQMILRHSKIRQSMSRKSTPYDSSPTESLIHKMKMWTVLDHN